MQRPVRTRYAPSPTGFFHIGGARSALFCYLFARHTGGTFIVRIEDTDFDREVKGAIDSQLDNLEWLGIKPDESPRSPGKHGPYITSEKLDTYKKEAHALLANGKAYRCFCTPEELEAERKAAEVRGESPRYSRRCLRLAEEQISANLKEGKPFAIRIPLNDERTYEWEDMIRGKIAFPGTSLTDPVILRSSGVATYNFAVVVDDQAMEITHVLRGEEHIANTPYQIAAREALGYGGDISFGHLSIIVDETGKKLSKRNKDLKQFIEDFKKAGYPANGIANFLALLGWSPADKSEIKPLAEIAKEFEVTKVSKSPATFDPKKLEWVCAEYVKRMSESEYLDLVKSISPTLPQRNADWVMEALHLYKPQVSSAAQAVELVNWLNELKPDRSSEHAKGPAFLAFREALAKLPDWSAASIKAALAEARKKTGLNGKDFFMPIRLAVSGEAHGPDLATLVHLIGKEEVLS